jgi:membrane complex biogenesis BtpA family protein
MKAVFGAPRALIGMLHLDAMPGAPRVEMAPDTIVERAVAEAKVYRDAGFTALMIENIHDRPYMAGTVGPEVVAVMTAAGRDVLREVDLPLGVQVLAAANREALAVAHACGATFIRAEAFVFAHVADEGLLQATAGPVLRYRREIGAEHIKVFADVKKKHSSHAITADVDLGETARAAEFSLADGVVVTGIATGSETNPADVKAAAAAVSIPTLVGSGVSPANMASLAAADGFIVGSSVKQNGDWREALDGKRVSAVAEAFQKLEPRE